jgi:hypothetical protein
MPGPAEDFRANKAARIAHAKTRLDLTTATASRAQRALYVEEVKAILDELDDMVEQAIRVKAEMISAAIDRRAQSQPAICSSCNRLLTESEADLFEYIELVAAQAAQMGWPADLCRAKLRAAMKCGDRVTMLGYGRVTIVKPDGTGFVVFQRES